MERIEQAGMRRAFTMVEILVVVGILVVLVAVAVPVSMKMINKGHRAACLGKLRNIGAAMESYLADNNDRYPEIEMLRATTEDPNPVLETVLREYVDNEDAFRCPADKDEFAASGCSYLWNSTQSGRHRLQTSFLGTENQPERVPLVLDKEAFHGDVSGVNMLYADYHLTNEVEFVAAPQ